MEDGGIADNFNLPLSKRQHIKDAACGPVITFISGMIP